MKPQVQDLLKSLDYSGEGQGHPNALCARAASAIREFLDAGEHGWLIETAQSTYWDGKQIGDDACFVRDANEACRFARFEDAEVARCWLLEKLQRAHRLRSAEHIFLSRAAADAA